jgi:hypothetical protein
VLISLDAAEFLKSQVGECDRDGSLDGILDFPTRLALMTGPSSRTSAASHSRASFSRPALIVSNQKVLLWSQPYPLRSIP